MDDAPRPALAGRQAEDLVALARAQVRVRRAIAAPWPSAGSTVKNSSGRTRSLCTPVGARSSPPPSAGPQIPPAGARHPALQVEHAEQLDQQLAGRALGLTHRSHLRGRRHAAARSGPTGIERNSPYTSPAMRFLSKFVDSNDREVRRIQPLVDATNALEAEFEAMSDEEIRAAFAELRAEALEAAKPDEPSEDELHHPDLERRRELQARSAAGARTRASRRRSTRSCPRSSR